LRALEKRMLRSMSEPRREEGDCIMGSFIICTFHQILMG
jgi:hypothetical protein